MKLLIEGHIIKLISFGNSVWFYRINDDQLEEKGPSDAWKPCQSLSTLLMQECTVDPEEISFASTAPYVDQHKLNLWNVANKNLGLI